MIVSRSRGLGVPADLRDAFDGGLERSAAGAAKADHVERSRRSVSRLGIPSKCMFFFGICKELDPPETEDVTRCFFKYFLMAPIGFPSFGFRRYTTL